jgi:hypothetical protein
MSTTSVMKYKNQKSKKESYTDMLIDDDSLA